eukprot:scaffold1162_cov170-Amphora_coffeaeformis.AAC.1
MSENESPTASVPDLSVNPVYEDFFQGHDDQYVRLHIHLVGVVSDKDPAKALGKRRNRFGAPRMVDAIADPYITVETLGGEATGSTDYFPIGTHKFETLQDCRTPIWDSKCLLLSKKEALEGIKFTLWDDNVKAADEALMTVTLGVEELPEPTPVTDSQWKTYIKRRDDAPSNDSRTEHAALEFSIMVTSCSERIASKEDVETICDGTGHEYSQVVLPDETEAPQDNALLQCWKHPDSTRAVLWILGRNDCFMHPHVARELFLTQGYDMFVLNYKMNGACRKAGWVTDPHYNAHNYSGNFNVYNADIAQALQQMCDSNDYTQVLGYAHSTGGPVLLNYLMTFGDAAFDGFLFNSPFLDWGFVGGDMVEFVLENTGFLEKFAGKNENSKMGVAETPEGQTPLIYLGKDIVLSDWSARLWSLYYFDWGSRPLYKVPMTVGFAKGVTAVHKKLREFALAKRPVTAKPFLCITSRGDDVLKAPETLSRADWIGPGRWEIELNDNGHDIFLSYDKSDTDMAIEMCRTWMKNRKLA